jgi:membrane-associated phospholipid phosphatase
VDTSQRTPLAAVAAQVRRPVVWLTVGLLAWGTVFTMVVTAEGLAESDRPVLSWLTGHRSPGVTALMEFVSSPMVAVLVPTTVVVATLTLGVIRGTWRSLATVLLAFGSASVISLGLKSLIQRTRPPSALMLGDPATGWSFPSGHTLLTSTLLGAVVLIGWQATARWIIRAGLATTAVAAALLMGMSRMYLGAHWLTDVLASYALAVATLATTAVILGSRRWSPATPIRAASS